MTASRPNRYAAARDPQAARQRVRPRPVVRMRPAAPGWSLPLPRALRLAAFALVAVIVATEAAPYVLAVLS